MKTKPICEEEHYKPICEEERYVIKHLSFAQWTIFVAWCEENEIDEMTIECEKDLKNGIRIHGKSWTNGESWEIDFTYEKENLK